VPPTVSIRLPLDPDDPAMTDPVIVPRLVSCRTLLVWIAMLPAVDIVPVPLFVIERD
jgi:hypothetical protein